MKNFLFFILLTPFMTFGQISVKGVVVSQNGKPLAYTNLVSIRKQIGATTDTNGIYHLNDLSINDTIKITNIAFQPILIPVKDLVKKDSLFLTEKLVILEEVVLTNFNAFTDREKMGYLKNRINYHFTASPSGQIGMYVENKRKIPGLIKELTFKAKQEGSCRNDFRIRFIEFDALKREPTNDLVFENIIIKGGDIKRTTKIDLSDYKILMPEGGVVVVFEWLNTDPDCIGKSKVFLDGNMNMIDDPMWFNYKDQSWHRIHRDYPTGKNAGLNVEIEVAYR